MAIAWVFLDMGYTLVNEDAVWRARCREQAETPQAREKGVTAETLWRDIEEASRNYRPQFRSVIEKHGFTQAAPYRSGLERLYPDAKDTLGVLAEKYRLGIIANQPSGLEARLASLGIRGYFSLVVSSWEAGVMKPDPAIFRLALARASCPPRAAVMVGDRLDNDIFPARALGMRTVWVRQGFGGLQSPRSDAYRPDAEIACLAGLPSALDSIADR